MRTGSIRSALILAMLAGSVSGACAVDELVEIGSPIYSAAGEHVGYVVSREHDRGRYVYVGEVSRHLGLGTTPVVLSTDQFHASGKGVRLNAPIKALEAAR